VRGGEAVAVEDSVTGARSAVGAGFPTVGNLAFVAEDDRAERAAALREAGVVATVESWGELEHLLQRGLSPVPA
jgi:beta-phosphoglucomutase-like phosphatase (HAD superfamily)